jgi:NAD-dependent dihydropyrimidine dehydrogenase PreA subunit
MKDPELSELFINLEEGGRCMSIESIDEATCIGCGTCVASCPMDVIHLSNETGKATIIYQKDCQLCHLCENYCPVGNVITIAPTKFLQPIVGWG